MFQLASPCMTCLLLPSSPFFLQPFTLPHPSPLYSISSSFSSSLFFLSPSLFPKLQPSCCLLGLRDFSDRNNRAGKVLSSPPRMRNRKPFSLLFPSATFFSLYIYLTLCLGRAPQAVGSLWAPGVICGCLAVNLSD